MTPDQRKGAERLDRYLAHAGLYSVMNDTKWREAMEVLQKAMGQDIRFRVKDVRGPEPAAGSWERSFPVFAGKRRFPVTNGGEKLPRLQILRINI